MSEKRSEDVLDQLAAELERLSDRGDKLFTASCSQYSSPSEAHYASGYINAISDAISSLKRLRGSQERE